MRNPIEKPSEDVGFFLRQSMTHADEPKHSYISVPALPTRVAGDPASNAANVGVAEARDCIRAKCREEIR